MCNSRIRWNMLKKIQITDVYKILNNLNCSKIANKTKKKLNKIKKVSDVLYEVKITWQLTSGICPLPNNSAVLKKQKVLKTKFGKNYRGNSFRGKCRGISYKGKSS